MSRHRSLAAYAVLLLFPLVVLALLALIGWGVWAASHVATRLGGLVAQLLLLPLLFGIVVAVRTVLKARATPLEGPELTRADHPAFFALLDDVSRAVGAQAPGRVVLVAQANAAVTQVGDHTELMIGVPLLGLLTVDELRALLGHELAHVAGGDTVEGARTLRWSLFLEAVHSTGVLLKPLFGAYRALYDWAAGRSSRDAESEADAAAVRVAGATAAASMLAKLPFASAAWDRFMLRFVTLFSADAGRAPMLEGLQRMTDAARTELDAEASELLATEKESFRDSHPLTGHRIEALRALPPTGVQDGRPASALLDLPRLTASESELFTESWPLRTWEEVMADGLGPFTRIAAVELVDVFVRDGLSTPTLGATISHLDATWPETRRQIESNAQSEGDPDPERTARENYHGMLRALAAGALVSIPGGVPQLTWSGELVVRTPDGRSASVDAVLGEVQTGAAASRVVDELRALGAPVDEPLSQAELTDSQTAAVVEVFAGTWGKRLKRAHLVGYTTGILVVPAPKLRAPMSDDTTLGGEPLGTYLERPLAKLQGEEGNEWIPFDAVAKLKVRSVLINRVELTMIEGAKRSWWYSTDSRYAVAGTLKSTFEGVTNRRAAAGPRPTQV